MSKAKKLFVFTVVAVLLSGCSRENVIGDVQLSLNENYVQLTVSENFQLEATAQKNGEPIDAEVLWYSSDNEVAVVDSYGAISATGKGRAVIKAVYNDALAVCEVSVVEIPVESVSLDKDYTEIEEGLSFSLTAEVLPENADDRQVIWTSSDDAVAVVSSTGKVVGVSEGTAVITARSGNVEASMEVYVMAHPQVGDIYFTDGTWGKEIREGKEALGVVFYTGNPSKHDEALKREHPECTHGLVMSMGDQYVKFHTGMAQYNSYIGQWIEEHCTDYMTITTGMGMEHSLNKIIGYNNTCALELFNDAPENSEWKLEIIDSLRQYRESFPAPETSSDWYLPSEKELSTMCSGVYNGNIWDLCFSTIDNPMVERRDILNDILKEIKGASLLDTDYWTSYYWSSSEMNQASMFVVWFYNGYVYHSAKDDDDTHVRYVLAF